MELSRSTNGKQMDSKENFKINMLRQRNIAHLQLKRRDQHTIQEDGTGHAWPNTRK
jgi:hypothetical protein